MCQSAKASLTFYEQINSVLNTLLATLGESLFGPNGFVSNMQLKKKDGSHAGINLFAFIAI